MVAHVAGKAFGLYEAFVGNADQTLQGTFTGIFFFSSFQVVHILLLIVLSCMPGDLLWVKAGGETHTYITNITAV